MDSQKQQAVERVKQANNILVTVSSNPSVDQLAACIGLTLGLNKMGKHATAVFSGAVPSTIEFLQPEKTIEKNTDSLRDFIIALDKSKADKLRYKVEDRVVKIFITPYRTSINEKDLEFSQGDFNVDVVVALGVHSQADLDQAITSHGRILHDATVITMNVKPGGELGGVNWLDPNASSLSELTVQLLDGLDKKLMDGQIATALLTGIVAETDRFSNAKTFPQTMSISAELMAAGANQQLVATKLEEPVPQPVPVAPPIASQQPAQPPESTPAQKAPDDGTLEIAHDEASKPKESGKPEEGPEVVAEQPKLEPAPEETLAPVAPQIHIDEHGALRPLEPAEPELPPKPQEPPIISHHSEPPKMVIEPPIANEQFTGQGAPGMPIGPQGGLGLPPLESPNPEVHPGLTPSSMSSTMVPPDPDTELPSGGLAPADSFLVGAPSPVPQPSSQLGSPQIYNNTQGSAQVPLAPELGKTLSDIEKDVHSSHLSEFSAPDMPVPTPSAPTPAPAPQGNDTVLPSISGTPANAMQAPAPSPLFADDQSLQSGPAQLTPNDDIPPTVDSARDAVAQAISSSSAPELEPIQALNAQPVDLPLGGVQAPVVNEQQTGGTAPNVVSPVSVMPQPAGLWNSPQNAPSLQPANSTPVSMPQFGAPTTPQPVASDFSIPDQVTNPNSPPPVPPPMMPPANPY